MKKIIIVTAAFALCFATGFTCSKNSPPPAEQQPPASEAVDQSQMQAPAQPATEGAAPAAPTEGSAPAQTAPVEKK